MGEASHLVGGDRSAMVFAGERVGLGPLREDLLPTYLRWKSNVTALLVQGSPQLHTAATIHAWFEEVTAPGSRIVGFTVYTLADCNPIGTIVLVDLDFYAGTAEMGILLGESRDEGLGTEAVRLVLDYAFYLLQLTNVLLTTFSWNERALAAFSKAGFREIGRRRGAVKTLRKRFDHVLMDAVVDDFEGSVLKTNQLPPT